MLSKANLTVSAMVVPLFLGTADECFLAADDSLVQSAGTGPTVTALYDGQQVLEVSVLNVRVAAGNQASNTLSDLVAARLHCPCICRRATSLIKSLQAFSPRVSAAQHLLSVLPGVYWRTP